MYLHGGERTGRSTNTVGMGVNQFINRVAGGGGFFKVLIGSVICVNRSIRVQFQKRCRRPIAFFDCLIGSGGGGGSHGRKRMTTKGGSRKSLSSGEAHIDWFLSYRD